MRNYYKQGFSYSKDFYCLFCWRPECLGVKISFVTLIAVVSADLSIFCCVVVMPLTCKRFVIPVASASGLTVG